MGLSIKYVTSFWPLLPPPLSHFVTHPETPKSTSHISNHLPVLVGLVGLQETRTKTPCISLNCSRGFLTGSFCLEGFVPGGFCPFLLQSEYICYNRKLNITLNFMFHMYDKYFYKLDVTCS